MNSEIEYDIIICECQSSEHQIIFRYFKDIDVDVDDKNYVYISYHLQSRTLWDRVKTAFNHILGKKSRFGDFGELILDSDDKTISKFERIVDVLKVMQKNNEKRTN